MLDKAIIWVWSGDAAPCDLFCRNDSQLKTACWVCWFELLRGQSFSASVYENPYFLTSEYRKFSIHSIDLWNSFILSFCAALWLNPFRRYGDLYQNFMNAKMGKTATHLHQNADVNCHISWTDWATMLRKNPKWSSFKCLSDREKI